MGKGRQIAALIFENFCRGRTKVMMPLPLLVHSAFRKHISMCSICKHCTACERHQAGRMIWMYKLGI